MSDFVSLSLILVMRYTYAFPPKAESLCYIMSHLSFWFMLHSEGLELYTHYLTLEKEVATHSSILAWKIPWTEKPGGLRSMGSQSWTWLSTVLHFLCLTPLCTHVVWFCAMFQPVSIKIFLSNWTHEIQNTFQKNSKLIHITILPSGKENFLKNFYECMGRAVIIWNLKIT